MLTILGALGGIAIGCAIGFGILYGPGYIIYHVNNTNPEEKEPPTISNENNDNQPSNFCEKFPCCCRDCVNNEVNTEINHENKIIK